MSGEQRLRIVLRGRVQGVGMRWAVQRRARELGLTGVARNAADGSVVIEAEGQPSQLDALERFLHQDGAPGEIDELDAQRVRATGEYARFLAR